MRCLFIGQRIGTSLSQWLDVIHHEGPWVQMGQRVVDGLAADMAGWLVSCDARSVASAVGTVALGCIVHGSAFRYPDSLPQRLPPRQ